MKYPSCIESIMPKSLDDVIRANRGKMKAYLTTDAELETLRKPVPIKRAKAEVSHWAFITFFMTKPGVSKVYLTGYNETERCSWMTSHVTAVDGHFVATKSGSLYKLVGEKSEELDLPHICATLNAWGAGKMLGVPEFFF